MANSIACDISLHTITAPKLSTDERIISFLERAVICFSSSVSVSLASPEPLGDYFAGPNHVLPTSGTARFFSPLSVDSFVKKSSFIYYTEDALRKDAEDVVRFAETEGLTAHANSIKVRFDMK